MLTATEIARIQKFTARMAPDTAEAIQKFFELTKPGCNETAYDVMSTAHSHNKKVSEHTIHNYAKYKIVNINGTIPDAIKSAIKKAVADSLLIMPTPQAPAPKPETLTFN